VSGMKMSGMDWVVWILLFVGGLNWGLVGAFDFNLVDSIFGVDSSIGMIVYILVGLAAIWSLFGMFMKKDSSTTMAQ
jgi:uncharacterized membrane protein YuzA (DUF378 family)